MEKMNVKEKKIYTTPALFVVDIESSSMLASSTHVNFGGSSDDILYPDPEGSVWGE